MWRHGHGSVPTRRRTAFYHVPVPASRGETVCQRKLSARQEMPALGGRRCQAQTRVGTLSSRRIGRLRMAQCTCNPDPSSRTEYCTCTVSPSPDGCPGRVSGRSGLQRSVGFGPCISQNIVWRPPLGLQSAAAFGAEFYQPACDMQHATCNMANDGWGRIHYRR